MAQTPTNTHAMSGNVQGFELPRGCLMTSCVILTVIVVTLIGTGWVFAAF